MGACWQRPHPGCACEQRLQLKPKRQSKMAGEQENVALASSALNHVHVPSSDTPQSLEKTKTSAYGAVVLALDSVVLPDAQLASTPSIQDGLTGDQEADLRILGCELIHVSGILLRLPQVGNITNLLDKLILTYSFCRSQWPLPRCYFSVSTIPNLSCASPWRLLPWRASRLPLK